MGAFDYHVEPMGDFKRGIARRLPKMLAGKPVRYLEIGVASGGSAEWMWRNVLTHPNCTADLVDPWQQFRDGEELVTQQIMDQCEAAARERLRPWDAKTRIFKMGSKRFFGGGFIQERYDLIYVDGDHTYSHVIGDLVDSAEKLSPGYLLVDDVKMPGVSRAIEEFEGHNLIRLRGSLSWATKHQRCYFIPRRLTDDGPVVVRAMWGDPTMAKWPEVAMEVLAASAVRDTKDLGHELVFAYGLVNYRILWSRGYDPILLCETPVASYGGRMAGYIEAQGNDRLGLAVDGSNFWYHKVDAILRAFALGIKEVVWLDWDTVVVGKCSNIFPMLRDGPAFQGRLRFYRKNTNLPITNNFVYHGGCYYVRGSELFESVKKMMLADNRINDEGAVTAVISRLACGQDNPNPVEHRRLGFDNPVLFATKRNGCQSDEPGLFREGAKGREARFARIWTDGVRINRWEAFVGGSHGEG